MYAVLSPRQTDFLRSLQGWNSAVGTCFLLNDLRLPGSAGPNVAGRIGKRREPLTAARAELHVDGIYVANANPNKHERNRDSATFLTTSVLFGSRGSHEEQYSPDHPAPTQCTQHGNESESALARGGLGPHAKVSAQERRALPWMFARQKRQGARNRFTEVLAPRGRKACRFVFSKPSYALRRRSRAAPKRPAPNSTNVPGSGTGVGCKR